MKPTTFAAVSAWILTCFSGLAKADFYIYSVYEYQHADNEVLHSDGFKFYNNPPSCDQVASALFQESKKDVSGDKYGVRCRACSPGDSGGEEGERPVLIEWNNKMGHFTWYSGRHNQMVDIHDRVVGLCYENDSDHYYCESDPNYRRYGKSQLFCSTGYTATSVNREGPCRICDGGGCHEC